MGMRPRLLDTNGDLLAPALTVLLAHKAPEESTAFFRFQVMKYTDPRETYEKALVFLRAEYYQDFKLFSDRLFAVFPDGAPLVTKLVEAGRCILDFSEGRHGFRLPCKVKALKADDPEREAAIWHNRVFNRTLPDTVVVLGFKPSWKTAETNF